MAVAADWRDERIAELEAEVARKDGELGVRDARIAELQGQVATLTSQVLALTKQAARSAPCCHRKRSTRWSTCSRPTARAARVSCPRCPTSTRIGISRSSCP